MQKTFKFSPEEISRYLLNRMRPGKRIQQKGRKGSLRAAFADTEAVPAGDKKKLSPPDIEQAVTELVSLGFEKEDLLKQISSDKAITTGQKTSITQDEVLGSLDVLGTANTFDIRTLTRMITPEQGFENSIAEARQRIDVIKSRISRLLADSDTAEAYLKYIKKKIETIRSARNVGTLQRLIEKSELARMALVSRRNSGNETLTAADKETMKKYVLIRKKAVEKRDYLMSNNDIYYEAKKRDLLEYRRQLLTDGFVETASIKKELTKIVSHLQLGIPVLLRGHLGAGKTEVALHVSRKYFGYEPEFISGSEEATKYDIYGKTQIGTRLEDDKMQEFRYRIGEYQRMNPGAAKKELKEVEKQYYQTIVVKGMTTSFFQYGPLMRAMKQGKPLIIDEMDGIPHSIIMRLNHVLTRRTGDKVTVQEDSGDEIIVKQGFCVLATGNIKSARYKREELDAAFLSRWWSNDIQYPPQDETYEILIASLLDKRGALQVKNNSDLDDLKRLTRAANEIQKIFSGEQLDYFGEGSDAARDKPASLKKSVLSLRHLWNITRPWKAHNFDRQLESYILDEFIKSAVIEDQIYLVQLFCRFRFFKNWKTSQLGIPGLTEAKLIAFQGRQENMTVN